MQEDFFPYIKGQEEYLADYFVRNSFKAKVIKKGDELEVPPKENICFIMKGRLKVYMINDLGDERLMWFLEEGNIIPNLMTDSFAKRVIADEDCEIYYMNTNTYYDYVLQNKEHMKVFIDSFYSRYGFLVQQLLNAESENARLKVYKFIYQLATRYGKTQANGEIMIENFPSRNDISSITGVHRSNVTRYITELEKACIVKKHKLQLSVSNLEQLKQEITALEEQE